MNRTTASIRALAQEVAGGAADASHASQLDGEASRLDRLVAEGRGDPALVLEAGEEEASRLMEDLEEVAREVAGAGEVVQQEIDRAQVGAVGGAASLATGRGESGRRRAAAAAAGNGRGRRQREAVMALMRNIILKD